VDAHERVIGPRSIRARLWAAGLLALLVAIVAWFLPAQPYQAPWAWISFIGMCIVDDFLLGSREDASWGEVPKIALLAAVIVFRRHPEITVLVVVVAAPLGSLIKGQRWRTQLTATAQWVLAAVIGAMAFRLVGFGDTPHFVAATAALMVVYFALGPLLSAFLEARLTATDFGRAFAAHRKLAIPLELTAVGLALAWRTPSLETAALKVADGALVAVAGLFAGYLLGGRSSRVFAGGAPVPLRPLLAAGAVLLISGLMPLPLSWLIPLGLAVVAGIWAVWRRIWPVACGALGAYCNEIVRAANDGRMPVDGQGVIADLGNRASSYVVAEAHTNLAWLDDRFHLPPPFPGIASAGDILIAIAMAWLVASLMLRRPAEGMSEQATGDATAPAAGAEAVA
jgi:hypothetical protein